jgi:hypothetical protein
MCLAIHGRRDLLHTVRRKNTRIFSPFFFFIGWKLVLADDQNCFASVDHIVHYLKMSKRDTNSITMCHVDHDCYFAVLTTSPLANPNRAVFAVAYPLSLGVAVSNTSQSQSLLSAFKRPQYFNHGGINVLWQLRHPSKTQWHFQINHTPAESSSLEPQLVAL